MDRGFFEIRGEYKAAHTDFINAIMQLEAAAQSVISLRRDDGSASKVLVDELDTAMRRYKTAAYGE